MSSTERVRKTARCHTPQLMCDGAHTHTHTHTNMCRYMHKRTQNACTHMRTYMHAKNGFPASALGAAGGL